MLNFPFYYSIIRCTEKLLKCGADIATIEDKSDRTALEFAKEQHLQTADDRRANYFKDITFLMLQERQGAEATMNATNHEIGKGLMVMVSFFSYQKAMCMFRT